MWEQYLEIAIRTTQETWPLVGTLMLVLVIPLMMFRVGRNSHLAAKGVNQLNNKVEELQNILEGLKGINPSSSTPEVVSDVLSIETPRQMTAEATFEASAKASVVETTVPELETAVPQENEAFAREEFSFDGNLAVEQPEGPQPQKEQVAVETPQPKEETIPAPAAPVPGKKDRNVVQCASCGNKLAYKGEWSGKKVKCPSCKDVVPLP